VPHDTGGAGMPLNVTGLLLTVSNAAVNRHDALVSGSGFDRLSMNWPHRPPTSNRPHQLSRQTFLPRLPCRPPSAPSAWASAPMKFLRILGSGPVVAQAATSCSAGRRVLPSGFSARAHAARLYGEFASGKLDSSTVADAASLVVTSVIVDHHQTTSVMSPRIEHAVLEE